jgi:hypothetical protein
MAPMTPMGLHLVGSPAHTDYLVIGTTSGTGQTPRRPEF